MFGSRTNSPFVQLSPGDVLSWEVALHQNGLTSQLPPYVHNHFKNETFFFSFEIRLGLLQSNPVDDFCQLKKCYSCGKATQSYSQHTFLAIIIYYFNEEIHVAKELREKNNLPKKMASSTYKQNMYSFIFMIES